MKKKNKQKKPFKIFIEFEGDKYDAYDIKRIEYIEEACTESATGMKYGLKISFKSYPFNKVIWYKKEETREIADSILQEKLQRIGTYII